MANKSTKKSKKPLQTTLGRAAAPSTGQKVDLSHVGKPIHTSVFSLSQVLSLTQTGTQEVQYFTVKSIYSKTIHFRLLIMLIMNVILYLNVEFAKHCFEVLLISFCIKENTVENNSVLCLIILGAFYK